VLGVSRAHARLRRLFRRLSRFFSRFEDAMMPMDVDAIVRAHGAEPIDLSYGKDCYALSLLEHVIGGGRPICALRRGAFARLFDKAIVKRALAHAANGVLTPACLRRALPDRCETFPVTLSRWGGKAPDDWGSSYYQTSRPGQNLLLQLNFPASHDRAYHHLVRPDGAHPFVMFSHPSRRDELFTLAWARLDVDLETNEVLIEEVQSDWIKEVEYYRVCCEAWISDGEPARSRFALAFEATPFEFFSYVERVVRPYARLWSECVLALAIEFSYSALGARRVFFHTHEGGQIMKRLSKRYQAPRSLYTTLPESFCFQRTRTPPRMFRGDPRLEEEVEWFLLELV